MDERNWVAPFERDIFDWRSLSLVPRQMLNEVFGRTGPSVDLHEDPNGFTLTAEIPGVSPDDLDITVNEQSVTLRGETRREESRDERGYKISERRYGSFYRTVPLPSEVKPDQATASYSDGVLEIRLTKRRGQDVTSRRIQVSSSPPRTPEEKAQL